MKKILSAVLLSTLGLSSVNAASVSSSMDVSARIERSCQIKSLSNVHFDYDPTANKNLVRDVLFKDLLSIVCNAGLVPNIAMSGSGTNYLINRSLVGEDGERLNYTMEVHDGGGVTFSAFDDVLLDGSGLSILEYDNIQIRFDFPKGQFVKGQNYSETITFTLSY